MARLCILRGTLVGARALVRALATRAGYPLAGTRIGAGLHGDDPVSGGPFVTRRVVRALKHPSLTRWAIPRSALVDPLLVAEGVNLATETIDLDTDASGTWGAAPAEDASAD